MRRIFGALLGLTVMVATAISAGDMPDEKEVQLPAPPAARATPAQIAIATKFLDLLSQLVPESPPDVEGFIGINIAVAAGVDQEWNLDEADLGEFREMLKPELLFLRKVCEPIEAEFRELSQSCDAALPEIARQFAAEQDEEQHEESDDEQKPALVRKPLAQRIQESVRQVAECNLTPEKWSQYSAELKLRTAHRKRVAILNLVSRLDYDLRLSSNQRDQYIKLLEANWNDAWGHSLSALANESNFMPALPKKDVFAILGPAQRLVFAELKYDGDIALNDASIDLFFEIDEEPIADEEETPMNGDTPQVRNALESDE